MSLGGLQRRITQQSTNNLQQLGQEQSGSGARNNYMGSNEEDLEKEKDDNQLYESDKIDPKSPQPPSKVKIVHVCPKELINKKEAEKSKINTLS